MKKLFHSCVLMLMVFTGSQSFAKTMIDAKDPKISSEESVTPVLATLESRGLKSRSKNNCNDCATVKQVNCLKQFTKGELEKLHECCEHTQAKIDACCQSTAQLITGTPTIKAPKLTVVLITEDFPYNQMLLLKPFLIGGLGTLINNGISYTNATYPEATFRTGPGHAAMSTGALSQTHGIVYNSWYVKGQQQFATDDRSALAELSLVYVANTSKGNPNGQTYPLSYSTMFGTGKSNRTLLADSIADQVQLYSTPASNKKFFYVSTANSSSSNSYLPAGQMGKPFCFDVTAGGFTSTTAFYPLPIVTISDPTGTNALATPVVSNGQITGIIVTDGGTGYTSPTITITDLSTDIGDGAGAVSVSYKGQIIGIKGTGTGATATATVTGGRITGITVNNPGSGYTGGLPDWVVNWNNNQNFNTITSYTQNLAYPANDPAYNLPNIYNYSLTPVSKIGIPRSTAQSPNQPLDLQGGSGATAIATVTNGVITSLTLTNGGSGYTAAPAVTINGIGNNGVQASATATITAGVVTSLTLVSGGSGYNSTPVVSIVNNALGAPNFYTTPFGAGYTLSPDGLEKVFSFLETLLDNNLSDTDELVVYVNPGVSLTSETYGIFNQDTVDMIYHLDQSFGNFISEVYKRVDPSDVLFCWTSDEGQQNFSQFYNQAGFTNAKDPNNTSIRTAINAAVLAGFGVANLIPSNSYIGYADVWFGPIFFQQNAVTQDGILQLAASTLQSFAGIKNVYTQNQLLTQPFLESDNDKYLRLELYPFRSGQLKYSTLPNFSFNTVDLGHVPLIFYQPSQFEHKTITEPVYINQLPLTLSTILGVPQPSSIPREFGALPGIFTYSVN